MAQLTCQKLCVGYDGKPVLQDLDFEVFAGDYLCIVGENGSGKSTLMKTILGLQMPISGRILTGDARAAPRNGLTDVTFTVNSAQAPSRHTRASA